MIDRQGPQYQELLKARYMHALAIEMKSWTTETGRDIATIPVEDILVKISSYFLERMRSGEVLFVGEGNLSFALNIAKRPSITASRMTVTTYEEENHLSKVGQHNALALRRLGASVVPGVDATNLEQRLFYRQFDTIVFQFPNVGSREPEEGRNPNFILVRDFLKSAAKHLRPDGQVLITAVDSPYYHGAFQFDEAAAAAGFSKPDTYCFDPSKLPGYTHTNTNNTDSAIDGHDRFCTWVFSLKKGFY